MRYDSKDSNNYRVINVNIRLIINLIRAIRIY